MTCKTSPLCGGVELSSNMSRQKFNDYLMTAIHQPFEWGKMDCITFANAAVNAQRGQGFVDDLFALRPYKTAWGALRLWAIWQKYTGFQNIIDLIDSRLTRTRSNHPPAGSVTARLLDQTLIFDYAIGVMGSRGPIYLTPTGFQRFGMKDDLSWGF